MQCGSQGGLSAGSNRYKIKKLEQQLQEHQSRLHEAEILNTTLLLREQVLLENVTALGETVHFVALEALNTLGSGDEDCVAQTVLQDVKVHELMQMLGNQAAANEPYTTRCMRAAFTPERVQLVRSFTLEQVVQQLRSMTMKLALLLQAEPAAAEEGADCSSGALSADDGMFEPQPLFSYTLDDVVDEYTELAMLLHVVSDKCNLKLGMLNLDTMCPAEPPAGHWRRVLNCLKLQPEQIQHITTCFQVYVSKTPPLVAETHELARRMQGITSGQPLDTSVQLSCTKLHAGSSTTTNMDTPRPAPVAAAQAATAAATPSDQDMAVCQSGESFSSAVSSSSTGGIEGLLTAAQSEELEWLSSQLLHKLSALRELHRTVTFHWLNTLDKRQKAISIVKSYPFWSQPLAMCNHLMEQQEALQKQQQQLYISPAGTRVQSS